MPQENRPVKNIRIMKNIITMQATNMSGNTHQNAEKGVQYQGHIISSFPGLMSLVFQAFIRLDGGDGEKDTGIGRPFRP